VLFLPCNSDPQDFKDAKLTLVNHGIEAYQKAIKKHPYKTTYYIDLVNAGFYKKELEQTSLDLHTRNAIREIITLAPNRKEGYLFHAYELAHDGLFDQALKELKTQQALYPHDEKIAQTISIVGIHLARQKK
ncbi:MAG: hypothetical protein AAB664_01040, partial [Patescibacteria group bacterium]